MIWQRVRVALLASMVALTAALPVAPGTKAHAGECIKTAPAVTTSSAAPAMRTIRVTETVPEYYTTTRTVNKMQQVQEKYTAYRIEKVPETRTRKVTVYEKVCVEENRTRTVCVNVPVCEMRPCQEKHWVCKQVTTMKRTCVDKGHWECKQVECGPSLCDRLKRNKCGDCCETSCKEPRYKTVKVWCPNKVWTETPCTKTVKVCEYRTVMKEVKTCKKETRVENYTCKVMKCIPKEKVETYTCCVERKIPVECTRTVCKCVPVQEEVRCCRMVKRCVEKQVPVEDCNPCAKPCKRSKCCN